MKNFKLLSLMALIVTAAGCGMQQQNPAAFNQGFLNNGMQTGWNTGWNNGGWNNGWSNPWSNPWNSAGQPIYNGNQVVGYRAQRPVLSGTVGPISTPIFSQSVGVTAGSRIFVNTANVRYGANIFCDRKFIDTYQFKWSNAPVSNLVISLNGQPIGGGNGGSVTVPANGTLTISADLSANDGIRCGANGDRPFRVLNYVVNLGQGVTVESCTSVQGQPIPCP